MKWSIFLTETGYCTARRGLGTRPCDSGILCDACHYDTQLRELFNKKKNEIDESLYCSCCGHRLKDNEEGMCEICEEFEY